MTLHFDWTMIIGLCMLPGGVVVAFLLVWLLAALKWELGAFVGAVPGVVVVVAGVLVFFVGLGMEIS